MHKVYLNGKELCVSDGELLSDILMKHGYHTEHLCGGNGKCGKCTVIVDDKKVLSCRYRVEKDICISLLENGEIYSYTHTDATSKLPEHEHICYVLDIGTTTLALALVSLKNGKIIDVKTRTNPQRVFGADVMTRIGYCIKNGITPLRDALCSVINSMIAEFGLNSTCTLYVSGNATMLHTFFGIDCSSMGKAPYTPSFLEQKTEKAVNLNIKGVETVISLPSISSFLGADIVAGLNYVKMPEEGKHSLFIDLGTNAEIVLFSNESALGTAAAAGPCFEGVNILCGMSATPGAIYAYSKEGIKTISDATPKGICGTGLIDVIAFLLEENKIDETGFMEDEKFEVSAKVILTQEDVRQYQLAKSAVYSAILTLMKIKGVNLKNIDKVYISGGFSSKINIESAIYTGLLPAEFKDKCTILNNSCLLGTVKYALENNDLSLIINNVRYVDLSSNSEFSELFVENMMFNQSE